MGNAPPRHTWRDSAKGEASSDTLTLRATLGAGCYWGTENYVKKWGKGGIVTRTAVGFMGGEKANPSYSQVCSGKTGHVEVYAHDACVSVYDRGKERERERARAT